MNIKKKDFGSDIKWYDITDKKLYINRRRFLKTAGKAAAASFCGFIHMLVYIGTDYLFNLGLIFEDISASPFILIGAGSLVLIIIAGTRSVRILPESSPPGARACHLLFSGHNFTDLPASNIHAGSHVEKNEPKPKCIPRNLFGRVTHLKTSGYRTVEYPSNEIIR